MSVTAAASAASGASKAASRNTVYLFRHIQTSQVLVSLKSSVEKQSLKQIANETRRPAHVRPDHWHPMVAIQGFEHPKEALSFHNSLRDHQLNMTATKTTDPKHMLQRRQVRATQEMNQVDETLVKMVELLNAQPHIKANSGKGFQILWERDGVREQILAKEGVSMPTGIEHGKLKIHRGRDILEA